MTVQEVKSIYMFDSGGGAEMLVLTNGESPNYIKNVRQGFRIIEDDELSSYIGEKAEKKKVTNERKTKTSTTTTRKATASNRKK